MTAQRNSHLNLTRQRYRRRQCRAVSQGARELPVQRIGLAWPDRGRRASPRGPLTLPLGDVRFDPHSGLVADIARGPKSANMRRSVPTRETLCMKSSQEIRGRRTEQRVYLIALNYLAQVGSSVSGLVAFFADIIRCYILSAHLWVVGIHEAQRKA